MLYFEGERHHTYRIIRAVKNRFGSTNEMGIFEMKENGLEEVANPSEIFLEERSQGLLDQPLSHLWKEHDQCLSKFKRLFHQQVLVIREGWQQELTITGFHLLMAVLEKRVGLLLQNQDAYLKVAGGVKLDEPAIDLAIAVSIASSFRDKPTRPTDCFIGEVGLTGEVRRVSRIEQRVQEAAKLGFERVILPANNIGGWTVPKGLTSLACQRLQKLFNMHWEGNL